MKPVLPVDASDKKGHVCPPSDAKHPSDRWETAFVYAFILKFTNLHSKLEGFETPMDLEDALMSPIQHPALLQILTRFILNLKPQTRNLAAEQISSTVQSVLQEFMKSAERTVFWNEDFRANVDPLEGIEGGFWGADWDVKLRVLRGLVELQLSHHAPTREAIDQAWGVVHNKHKKKDPTAVSQVPAENATTRDLLTVPIGQDMQRKRYWAVDDSPRLYVSSNPWKVTATFQAISSTREEYLQAIGDLKDRAPPEPQDKNERRPKIEVAHHALLHTLQGRLETIDAELARVQKVRRKIEQAAILKAQGEIRETRTRLRQTRRPDYVDYDVPDDEEDYQDEYVEDHDDEYDVNTEEYGEDDFIDDSGLHIRPRSGTRRSRRSTESRRSGVPAEWRAERRSTRLDKAAESVSSQRPVKRARTNSSGAASEVFILGAPADYKPAPVKPNEVVMEQVAGKKKSKFWYYAVEAIPGAVSGPPNGIAMLGSHLNGLHGNGNLNNGTTNGSEQSANSDAGVPSTLPQYSPMIEN